jgi:hypothetical protein
MSDRREPDERPMSFLASGRLTLRIFGSSATVDPSLALPDHQLDFATMRSLIFPLLVALPSLGVHAQEHRHTPGMTHPSDSASVPSTAGQAAFATIQAVVRLLEADPTTDWSRVNIEALRQHLIDMNDVTMSAAVSVQRLPDGAVFSVRGTGRVRDAIQRMVVAHSRMLDQLDGYRAQAAETATGARLTVRARDGADSPIAIRIRSLGFIGVMTLGDHHDRHHVALARGAGDVHAH